MRLNPALEFLDSNDMTDLFSSNRLSIPLDAGLEHFSEYDASVTERRETSGVVQTVAGDKDPTLQIMKGADAYHVYMSMNFVSDCREHGEYAALVLWIRHLTVEDTVVFHLFGASQKVTRFTLLDYATLLNAIFVSPAKTVCHVDFAFQGVSSYIALACQELCLTPFSRLAFHNLLPQDAQIPLVKTFSGFVQNLLERGVEKKILSVEEVTKINDGLPIVVSYSELKSRTLTT